VPSVKELERRDKKRKKYINHPIIRLFANKESSPLCVIDTRSVKDVSRRAAVAHYRNLALLLGPSEGSSIRVQYSRGFVAVGHPHRVVIGGANIKRMPDNTINNQI